MKNLKNFILESDSIDQVIKNGKEVSYKEMIKTIKNTVKDFDEDEIKSMYSTSKWYEIDSVENKMLNKKLTDKMYPDYFEDGPSALVEIYFDQDYVLINLVNHNSIHDRNTNKMYITLL